LLQRLSLALLAFVAGGRPAERIALTSMPLGLAIAIAIMVALKRAGAPLVYLLGGWAPPLGIVLRADGLSAVPRRGYFDFGQRPAARSPALWASRS
jgi:formate hydrogenlyase subunit 3/multisubunit Na+/H+ antiporter MnhD subunit